MYLFALIACVIAVIVTLGFYVSWRATRLDRLHARLDTALAALDAALVRRCVSVLEVATSGLLNPAASLLLIEAEQEARVATAQDQRELAESRLSQALRAVWESARLEVSGSALLEELETSSRNISIARHFYNDSVNLTISARRRFLARILRLAGGAPMPAFFEMDDALV